VAVVLVNKNIIYILSQSIIKRQECACSPEREENCVLFLSAMPMLGGAKEKFCIEYFCGCKGRVSVLVFMGRTFGKLV